MRSNSRNNQRNTNKGAENMKVNYRGLEANVIKHSSYYEICSDDGFINEIMSKSDFRGFVESGDITI